MGNRGHIVIRSHHTGDVWLYSHKGGDFLHRDLRAALDRGRDHWDDPSYLARIVFCQMLHGDVDGTQGYGITGRPDDNEQDILVADTDARAVLTWPPDYTGGSDTPTSRTPFAEYVRRSAGDDE